MNTYRFHAAPAFNHWNYRVLPTLTADSLTNTLAGAVVRNLVTSSQGGYYVEVQLDRTNHQDAVADIHAALTQLGFNTAQAVITEWATSVVEGALLGTAGGGALGSTTKDPLAMLFSAAIGLLVGAAVGSGINTVKAMYQADRVHWSRYGWQFTQLPLPRPQLGPQNWSQA